MAPGIPIPKYSYGSSSIPSLQVTDVFSLAAQVFLQVFSWLQVVFPASSYQVFLWIKVFL